MKQLLSRLGRLGRIAGRIFLTGATCVLDIIVGLIPMVFLMPLAATCWQMGTLSSDWSIRGLLFLCMAAAWWGAIYMIETRIRIQTQNEIYKNLVAAIAAGKNDD